MADKNTTDARRERSTIRGIQKNFFRAQLILVITLALFLGAAGTLINLNFETRKRDQNLQNIAEAIAQSPILTEPQGDSLILTEYLDSLHDTLDSIDVISVVSRNNMRLYHSTHELIGTLYDGELPEFEGKAEKFYAVNASGPSGSQRRAYAAIYDENGEYAGFVMAIMLMTSVQSEIMQTLFIYALITVIAILMELMISSEVFGTIRESLLGYEPDVFSAMYQIRDNILESLDEGVIAVDSDGIVQFANSAAAGMIRQTDGSIVGRKLDDANGGALLLQTLQDGEKELLVQDQTLGSSNILIDRIPIREDGKIAGAVGILHDRAEYTRLMEDLTGTRYLVDSMRANNHDFTNKLHVILGLIQMGMYDKATEYIENITIVQRAAISAIMNAVSDPAVAALLIGKTARASELDIKLVLREGSRYSGAAMALPSEVLVTIIGNLIDNAFEAMNEADGGCGEKELLLGIYSKSGAVLITTDDTGSGILPENLPHIFENGFSTKGEGRGTGLYQVKNMVEGLGGTITVESQAGAGTSFCISFSRHEA